MFIATSSKDDLYRRIGGRCTTNNMKVVFKVCCKPEEQQNNTINGQTISGNGNTQQTSHSNNINIQNGGGGGGIIGQPSSPTMNGGSTSINTNIDQFNRIPVSQNGASGIGMNTGNTGIRINNMQPNGGTNGGFMPPMTNINTNSSNVVQSTMSWPGWGNNNAVNGGLGGINMQHSTPVTTIGLQPQFYPPHMTSPRPNINSAVNNNSNYSPSHKPTKKTSKFYYFEILF